ncbi:MAG: amino acid adenylation domain-containing protein [Gammaproteobacteria bacterium]
MTAHQQVLANLFGDLLGRPVDLDDDFFACGGHSLLATRLLARIRADFGVALPLRTLFESSSVRALSETLAAAGTTVPAEVTDTGVTVRTPQAAGRSQQLEAPVRAPLSLVQQRLWFLDRLQPQNSVYHLAWAFHLRGPLNRTALKAALDQLVKRHGALRTCFPEHDGVPEQYVVPSADWPLQTLKSDPASVPQLLADAAATPFKLASGPLVRALLVETGSAEFTLLLVVHHIVADGWSLGVLSRELAALYAAGRQDAHAVSVTPLPPLVRAYTDYASEQRRTLAGGELQRQLAWWEATLRDIPPFIDLPTDRPRPALTSNRGSRLTRVLPVERQAGLHELAGSEACTFFMVVLAAMNVLLARYAGTEDVVVGTPVAGRSDQALEGMVGFFVNTLVLRTVLSGNPSVRELLRRVRHTTLDAYENADVPFELLVEVLQPPRSTNRTPLFQVLFNLHNEPTVPLELDGLEVQAVAVPRNTTKFDLGISLAETAAGLSITVEYNRDLFLQSSIERFIADYDVVLSGFIATPDAPLNALPFSAGEQVSWATDVASPTVGATLPAALAETVARYPQALAVSAPASSGAAGLQPAIDWTYAELAQQVARIAAGLEDRGVQAGDRVALWFGHGAAQIAALLGVLEAGAVYVPLDPLAPAERLAKIIDDAGAGVVLTDRWAPAWPVSLSAGNMTVLACETLPAGASTRPSASAAVHPDSLAYLLYTSGSTGTPKGVPQTHRNVLQHVRTWASRLGVTPADRLSLLSTCGYDAAVQDIFGALLTGASVCPLDIRRLARETLLDRIADRGLTVLHSTPSAYRYLFGGHVACRQDLSRVRLVVLGGEPARRADFELYCARFGKTARFVNGYGMTEATAVTQWFAGPQTRPYGQQLPIGRPVGGEAAVRLLDEHGEPAAFVGELVLDASSVTPAYWSASGKLPDEHDRQWFHTGDIARVLPDGNLVFVGRRDERLKISGIRIEPAEVEAALCGHPAVAEAAVMARLSEAGDPVLVAFYVHRSGAAALTTAELRAHLSSLLPGALIPAHFHSCAVLPRLPNGKVDRTTLLAGLPGTAAAVAPAAGAGIAAASGIENGQAVLTDIWQKLLLQNDIGLDDNFFALGGHSLLATRLVARIRDRLGMEVPLIRLFEAPTIRSLASIIAASPGILPEAPGIRKARTSE